jgi:hypothetical protein
MPNFSLLVPDLYQRLPTDREGCQQSRCSNAAQLTEVSLLLHIYCIILYFLACLWF